MSWALSWKLSVWLALWVELRERERGAAIANDFEELNVVYEDISGGSWLRGLWRSGGGHCCMNSLRWRFMGFCLL